MRGVHGRKFRFTQILEAVATGALDEFVEVNWNVEGCEVVVVDRAGTQSPHTLEFAFEQLPVRVGLRPGFHNALDELDSLMHAFFGAGSVTRLEKHHVTDHISNVSAGIGVIADISDAIRGQSFPADGEHFLLYFGRNPGIDTMSDDVVELALRACNVTQIDLLEFQVGEAESFRHRSPLLNGPLRKVYTQTLALREAESHGNQIRSIAATQFQNPAGFKQRRRHSKQRAMVAKRSGWLSGKGK